MSQQTLFDSFEGPRLIRREELIDSMRLARICFGGALEIHNEEQILAEYDGPRRGGTYALLSEGRPVSQIAIVHDRLKIYDGMIRTGSIGGVCTHPDYRGRGLASRLLQHCTEQLRKEGARLMLISGDGGIYERAGSVLQGKFAYFSARPEQASQGPATSTGPVLRRATPADARLCGQLYRSEPIHFIRPVSRFAAALHAPLDNTYIHAEPWIVERAREPVAYVFLGVPYEMPLDLGIRHVAEYAGSRAALADSIPALMAAGHLQSLTWPVPWQDLELIRLLEDRGYRSRQTNLDGHTLRLIDFPAFMQDLRPVLRERLDADLLRGLRFEQSGPLLAAAGEDRYSIRRGRDRVELDGAAMTFLVMGNADSRAEAVHAPGALAEVLSALFPLPSFLPGLNYH